VNNAVATITTTNSSNPDLTPEVSLARTAGLVFTPHWGVTEGFRFSADYFYINVKEAITSVSPQSILDGCLRLNVTSLCPFITFSASSPNGVSNVNSIPSNLSQIWTEGESFEAAYTVPIENWNLPGSLNARLLLAHVDHLVTVTNNITSITRIDQAGGTTPKWRWTVDANYALDQWSFGAAARIQSSLKYDTTLIGPDDPRYSPALPNSINQNIFKGATYVDLNAAYDVKSFSEFRALQIYGVINNVFNKQPPLGYNFVNGGTAGGLYDYVGRTFKMGVRFTY
jgi:outer membrane receptor for ferrienterochelin and colicin